jgi:glutamyl-tRNA reductase
MKQYIFVLGLNHRTAPVEVREKFAPESCEGAPEGGLIALKRPLTEYIMVSTCNRVEIIGAGENPEASAKVLELWAASRDMRPEDLEPYTYLHEDLDAVRHVFSVTASLDSMVLGEPQILGQIKDAYREAVKNGTSKALLNGLMHRAFSVAKEVRSRTEIAVAAVSISYAAVELARKIFGDMGENSAMLIGAGEMAELAATHLKNAGIREIMVANRTFERAEALAARYQGRAVPFEQLFEFLHEADIVISSTGAQEAVVRARDVKPVLKKRKNRPMFFIDIAVPRDIDPDVNALDNVYLYDIDDLKEVVEENLERRREAADKARSIIEDKALEFDKWLESLELKPTIVDLLCKGEDIGRKELEKTLKRLGPVDEETERALKTLVDSLVRKLYREPIVYLKRRSSEEGYSRKVISETRRIFNLDEGQVSRHAHSSRKKNPSEE